MSVSWIFRLICVRQTVTRVLHLALKYEHLLQTIEMEFSKLINYCQLSSHDKSADSSTGDQANLILSFNS